MLARKCVEQKSCGEQRETKSSTPEVEVMTDAMLESPMHPRKKPKCFANMSKNNRNQTSCAQQL